MEGVIQPAPAPRFSKTSPEVKSPPALVAEHTEEILMSLGIKDKEIKALKSSGGVA